MSFFALQSRNFSASSESSSITLHSAEDFARIRRDSMNEDEPHTAATPGLCPPPPASTFTVNIVQTIILSFVKWRPQFFDYFHIN